MSGFDSVETLRSPNIVSSWWDDVCLVRKERMRLLKRRACIVTIEPA